MTNITVPLALVEAQSRVIVFVDVKVHSAIPPSCFCYVFYTSYKSSSYFSTAVLFIHTQITQIGLKVSPCAFSKAYCCCKPAFDLVQPGQTEGDFRVTWLEEINNETLSNFWKIIRSAQSIVLPGAAIRSMQ